MPGVDLAERETAEAPAVEPANVTMIRNAIPKVTLALIPGSIGRQPQEWLKEGMWRNAARSRSTRGLRVQVLEKLVRGELDLLVPPLGGAVVAGDQPHAVQAPEVAVHERVARLRFIVGALRQAQVPDRVI